MAFLKLISIKSNTEYYKITHQNDQIIKYYKK